MPLPNRPSNVSELLCLRISASILVRAQSPGSSSKSPMSLNDTSRYLPRWQDFHKQSKEFDAMSSLLYLGIGLLTTLYLYRYLFPKDEKNAVRKLGGFPIFTAWTFFTRRYDFIWENFRSDPSPHFKFNVLHVSSLYLCHWSGRLLTNYAAQCHCFTWRGGSESIL